MIQRGARWQGELARLQWKLKLCPKPIRPLGVSQQQVQLLDLLFQCFQARSHGGDFGALQVEGDRLLKHLARGLPGHFADGYNLLMPIWGDATSNVGILRHSELVNPGDSTGTIIPQIPAAKIAS
jgi:hypothetical protein